MTYTPTPGLATDLELVGNYVPPRGLAANLNFMVLLGINTPVDVVFTTDNARITSLAYQPIVADIAVTQDATVAVSAIYDAAVWRGLVANIRAPHQQADRFRITAGGAWQPPPRRRQSIVVTWQAALATPAGLKLDAGLHARPRPGTIAEAWQMAWAFNQSDIDFSYRLPPARQLSAALSWDEVLAKSWTVGADWLNPPQCRLHVLSPWDAAYQAARAVALGCNQAPRKLKTQKAIAWRQGLGHCWIIGWPPIVLPPEPPRVWSADLVFLCKKPAWVDGLTVDLIFKAAGCPWGSGLPPIIVPILRSYFVSNAAAVVILPNLTPLEVTQINISADIDSWCWSFSATLPTRRQLGLIKPAAGQPVEVRVTVNGVVWEFAVEGYADNRVFGKTGLTIKGRSKSAYLAEPYAPIGSDSNALDILAHQIADLAVLNTGFTVDWQVPDWLVLAGAWNHRGTPLARLTTLAEAIGGSVQSATQAQTLSIVKRYPVLPWDWGAATPYAMIPLDAMLSLGEDWAKKPDYNAVYVSGEAVGISAQVKRTGTAANIVAPMAVSPLITHADAARMRGEAILADTGAQGAVSITLALDATLGMVPPGKLLEIEDATPWRGLTRGVSIAAQWSEELGLTVRQQLEVEKHYG